MKKKHFVGIGIFLVIVLGWMCLYNPDSDQKMISYFQKHQINLDKIVTMAKEDSTVKYIGDDYVLLEDYKVWRKNTDEGFNEKRLNQYQNLFAKFNGYDIRQLNKGSNIIYIPVSNKNSLLDPIEASGSEKGFAYTLNEPSPLVNSLDDLSFGKGEITFKKIEGNWYLYYQWYEIKPE